jgi:hypothetical protein
MKHALVKYLSDKLLKMEPELLQKALVDIQEAALVLAVHTDESAEIAAESLRIVAKLEKNHVALRQAATKPHKDAAKAIEARYAEPLRMLAEIRDVLSGKLSGYRIAVKAKAEAVQAALDRQEREREAAAALAAREADMPELPPMPPAPAAPPPSNTIRTGTGSVHFRKVWRVDVDLREFILGLANGENPDAAITINLTWLQREAVRTNGEVKYRGVTFRQEEVPVTGG